MVSKGFDIKDALNDSTLKGVRTAVDLPVEQVMPNRFQPRMFFRNIDELAESIRMEGQLEPIAVRVLGDGAVDASSHKYEVIYGGRRLAACEKVGKGTVNAIVYGVGEVSDEQMELWANIENTQREDLKFLEAMKSFVRLFEKYGSAKAVSERTGKTETTVKYYLNVAKAFDCHDEFKRILKDVMGSSKKADGFTYTVGGRFAQVAHHIASLDPDVSLRGESLKKNKREFRRIIERFDKQGLVESMKWAEDKIARALRGDGGKKAGPGDVGGHMQADREVFSENEKEIRLSVSLRKDVGISREYALSIRESVGQFLGKMDDLTVKG